MQVTLANWRSSPFNRWAFHHVRELIPSADIPNDPAAVRRLPLEAKEFDLEAFLRATDTDGMAIVHRGKLVFEHYASGMTEETPHILMSVSKSMLGLLIHELGIDASRRVVDILPELESTAYRDATVRHLLDMRAGIVWEENYLATSGPIVEYRKATGWNPSDGVSDLHSFYATLKDTAPHGGPVHYVSPNSDLLGWVVERATGRRVADLMAERVWKKAGAERGAYVTVDRLGAPRAAGGMCTTLRDLARVGQWLLEERAGFLTDLEKGDAQAWSAGDMAKHYPGLPMRYRNQWYLLNTNPPLAFAMGIHGQNLFIDRVNEIVIAKFSSQAMPLDAARIALTMRAVAELRKQLA
ncbi:MAG: serine hydrolase domain-containing protein [Burkholderiales bacterium]